MTVDTYSGRRVVYRGPVLADVGVVKSYRDEFRTGTRRPPTPEERLTLRPGDEGTVGAFLGVDDSGHRYEVDFDNGAAIDITLPSTVLDFVDDTPG